jgi:hypothetical protein
MKKQILIYILSVLCVYIVNGQKGNNQVTLLIENTVPIYQNDQGFGGFIKGLYGIGKSAQLTFAAGLSGLHSKNPVETQKITTRLIPFLVGYKQNIKRFFLEPQIGFGELSGKISEHGDFAKPSVGALFWALGAGYTIKRFLVGLRFESAHAVESTSAGLWHNQNFHYTSINIGYNIFQKIKGIR